LEQDDEDESTSRVKVGSSMLSVVSDAIFGAPSLQPSTAESDAAEAPPISPQGHPSSSSPSTRETSPTCNERFSDSMNGWTDELKSEWDSQGNGCEAFDPCDNPTPELLDAADAAARLDAAALGSLIAESEGRVVVNEARRALQGYGCRGRVVLHVPVSDSFIQQVQAEVLRLSEHTS
jgi:hypothetical protein